MPHLLGIFLHRPLEEALAPLARPDAVVLARRVVPAHRAQQPRPARLAGALVGGGRPRPPVGQRGRRRGRRRAQRVADNLLKEVECWREIDGAQTPSAQFWIFVPLPLSVPD